MACLLVVEWIAFGWNWDIIIAFLDGKLRVLFPTQRRMGGLMRPAASNSNTKNTSKSS
jgi:hypothetical protein